MTPHRSLQLVTTHDRRDHYAGRGDWYIDARRQWRVEKHHLAVHLRYAPGWPVKPLLEEDFDDAG